MKILLGFTDLEEDTELSTKTKSLMYEKSIFADLQETEMKNNENAATSKKNYVTITEIKTHALNILRALFKHAQLGDLSRTYAADGLSAAIRSYDGKTWAVSHFYLFFLSPSLPRVLIVENFDRRNGTRRLCSSVLL